MKELIREMRQDSNLDDIYEHSKVLVGEMIFAEASTDSDKKDFIFKAIDHAAEKRNETEKLSDLLEEERMKNKELYAKLKKLAAIAKENRVKIGEKIIKAQRDAEEEAIENEFDKLERFAKRHFNSQGKDQY